MQVRIRGAVTADAAAIAAIYNEGIAGRGATFETTERDAADVAAWVVDGRPLLVAERDDGVKAWARVSAYSDRCVYAGVGEYTIYVAGDARGHRIGTTLLAALVEHAAQRGYHKLVGRLLDGNDASLALARRCGFRIVGVHQRHGRLDGRWRDVILVERVLPDAD